jgi:cell cycle checkpoint protein
MPLSLAGYMSSHRNTAMSSVGFWDEDDTVSSSLLQAAAGSVAARGFLFANAHPAPSKWVPVRGPSCYLPERAAAQNLGQLAEVTGRAQRVGGGGDMMSGGGQRAAAQVLPFLRILGGVRDYGWLWQGVLPSKWYGVWQGAVCERWMGTPPAGAGFGPGDLAGPSLTQGVEGDADDGIEEIDTD